MGAVQTGGGKGAFANVDLGVDLVHLIVLGIQDALDAVSFIFDQGGAAVQHSIVYFYAPALCTSGFHESQEFVVAHNSHRFFDRW